MRNSELVTPVGTKNQFYLSGNRDEDRFLTENDMSVSHWELLMGCSHQGQCDEDVEQAAQYFEVKCYESIRQDLKEYGAWSDEELQDDEENLKRYLWTLSGDIQEETKGA
jgi:hypothetical protein